MDRKKLIYIGSILIITVILSITCFSYAFFTNKQEFHGKLNIVAGTLDYEIISSSLDDNNSITLAAGANKEIEIVLKNINGIDTQYILYYQATNNNVSVTYPGTTSSLPSGTINANQTKKITVILHNSDSSATTFTFAALGGFTGKSLTLTTGNQIVAASNDATLRALSMSGVTLSPTFSSSTTSYSTTVEDSTSKTVTATPNNSYATYAVSGNSGWSYGNNTVRVVVTAEDKVTTKTYTITVNRVATILKQLILQDNTVITTAPTLTKTFKSTTDASGLYSKSVTAGYGGVTGTGTTYYFRGNVTNNYVDFAGLTWRIVRINEDGTVRLILDEPNVTTTYKFNSSNGTSTNTYYSNSSVKNSLATWYTTYIDTPGYSSKVATGNYYCEALRVSTGTTKVGSVTPVKYSNYTPDLTCPTDANSKGLISSNVGLITYDEMIFAGLYYKQADTTVYMYKTGYKWWSMSPAGVVTKASAWHNDPVSSGKYYLNYAYVDNADRLRPVINLKSSVQARKLANGHYEIY